MKHRNLLSLFIIYVFLTLFVSAQLSLQGDTVIKVPLYNQNNTFYYGDIQIGTPPQSFKVAFATNFLAFSVPSTLCTSNFCQSHAKYDSNLSSTYIDTNGSTQLGGSKLGPDYSCLGNSANDSFILGGVQIPSIEFVDANNYAVDFMDAPFDVLCGLLVDDPSFPVRPLYAQLLERGELADTKFAVTLTSEPGDSGSFFIMGGYDTSKAPRGFDYYDVLIGTGSWIVQAEDFGLGNTSYANTTATNGTLYLAFDIALTSTYGGGKSMKNLISALGTLDCTHILHYPDFYVTIKGKKYVVPPRNYIFGSEEGCELGLEATDLFEDGFLLLGNHFMKSHYTVFDFGSNQIGVAKPPPHEEILNS